MGKGAMNEPRVPFTSRWDDYLEQYRGSAKRIDGEKSARPCPPPSMVVEMVTHLGQNPEHRTIQPDGSELPVGLPRGP